MDMFPAGAEQAVAERLRDLAGAILLQDAVDQVRLLAQIALAGRAKQRAGATCLLEQAPFQLADAQARQNLGRQRRAQQLCGQRQSVIERRTRAGSAGCVENIAPVERSAMAPQQLGDIAEE